MVPVVLLRPDSSFIVQGKSNRVRLFLPSFLLNAELSLHKAVLVGTKIPGDGRSGELCLTLHVRAGSCVHVCVCACVRACMSACVCVHCFVCLLLWGWGSNFS